MTSNEIKMPSNSISQLSLTIFLLVKLVWALAPLEFPLHDLCRTGHRPSFLLGFALLEF